ncbi:MAG: magnesium transporter CorA family protein [Clostridiales bacterium]|jgi:magnesium transporter|nr:magnesium transporter CorA family protein [Clostridiales bacterium]
MKIYDFSQRLSMDRNSLPDSGIGSGELFILCSAREVPELQRVFGWDESTVLDCADLDESVRYTGYDGYDFVSLVHMELAGGGLLLREINLYISSRYLVLVAPEHDSPRLRAMETAICSAPESAAEKGAGLGRLYFLIFHQLLADFSDMLEEAEDMMEALAEAITESAAQEQLAEIGRLRKITYTAKKQLRSLSYIGAQILIDENGIIDKKLSRYFRSIDTRLKKLYDFAESLYELGNELLHTYDSRLTIKMTDTVNKLTLLTLFFGPLTVITGIYGMNFRLMPELDWPYGYPLAICLMAAVTLILYRVLKLKKWL